MWNLLNKEQREEVILALEWDELPRPQKLEFFSWLPETAKAKILALGSNTAREKATGAEHQRLQSAQHESETTVPKESNDNHPA
jgi:hypothetical protein